MPPVLEAADPREKEARLKIFAEVQSSADAQTQADELDATIASTKSAMHAASADLRTQIDQLRADVRQVEQPFQDQLTQLNDERSALLNALIPQDLIADRIRRSMPTWLREERHELTKQVDPLVQRLEQLKHVKGMDNVDRQKQLDEVENELTALSDKFARIDHVAATVAWPTPEDLAE